MSRKGKLHGAPLREETLRTRSSAREVIRSAPASTSGDPALLPSQAGVALLGTGPAQRRKKPLRDPSARAGDDSRAILVPPAPSEHLPLPPPPGLQGLGARAAVIPGELSSPSHWGRAAPRQPSEGTPVCQSTAHSAPHSHSATPRQCAVLACFLLYKSSTPTLGLTPLHKPYLNC